MYPSCASNSWRGNGLASFSCCFFWGVCPKGGDVYCSSSSGMGNEGGVGDGLGAWIQESDFGAELATVVRWLTGNSLVYRSLLLLLSLREMLQRLSCLSPPMDLISLLNTDIYIWLGKQLRGWLRHPEEERCPVYGEKEKSKTEASAFWGERRATVHRCICYCYSQVLYFPIINYSLDFNLLPYPNPTCLKCRIAFSFHILRIEELVCLSCALGVRNFGVMNARDSWLCHVSVRPSFAFSTALAVHIPK